MHIPTPLYRGIVSKSVKGPNDSGAKAERMRQFLIPLEYNEPLSPNAKEQRYIRIFAAIVTEKTAFVLCDFSRLIKFHITSKEAPWSDHDMKVGSWVGPAICLPSKWLT